MIQKKKKDAEKRAEGKKTSGRRSKRGGFYRRPDKSKTLKRRAQEEVSFP
jgi:hypothetical protein